jgi:hypothetical protein
MGDHESMAERGRALEEEYFRRKNRELVERMQREARDEQGRRDMGAQLGIDDAEMLAELQKLGFTADTVRLLPFVPIVQTAWADGEVAAAERSAILELARARGIAADTPANHQLAAWLADRPAPEVFAGATRLIRALLDAPGGAQEQMSAEDLVGYCESIAAASGGLFGLKRVSAAEHQMLEQIASQLRTKR